MTTQVTFMMEKISKENQIKIELMKSNLRNLRKLAGWTAEDLGERLGVYKQTICNLEGENSTLSLIQYIAIRSVFEAEVSEHPEKLALAQAIPLLLDESQLMSRVKRKDTEEKVEQLARTASSGVDQKTLSTLFSVLLPLKSKTVPTHPRSSKWMLDILGSMKKHK